MNENIYAVMQKDKAVRKAIVKRSHKWFFYYYFSQYIEFRAAPFHDEMFKLSETEFSVLVISAFRNSGKSTLLSLSYPIWLIIGGKAKYVLLGSENQAKAQLLLSHIRNELENNELLKRDLGPFKEEKGWNSTSLFLNNYNAKITAISTEQSVRGMRHNSNRPDLIILDDIESQDSVRTIESRNKLHQWLTEDVIPAGHTRTKMVVIGSVLHPDSLIKRLQKSIDEKKTLGAYRMYPIVDEKGNSTWPGKFPDTASIEREKKRGITDRGWMIEYMLTPILDEEQIIKEEWINYYDKQPHPAERRHRYAATGVDLAIAQKETSDYTAMVSGIIAHEDDIWRLYILPFPVCERLNGPQIQERISAVSYSIGNGVPTSVYIEDVAFQKVMIDLLKDKGIPAEGVFVGGGDKTARLVSISELIKSGKIVFPRNGAKKLINQLLLFGFEKHEDLVDALVVLVMKTIVREGTSRLFVPRDDRPDTPEPSQKDLEDKADQQLIIEQELACGDPRARIKAQLLKIQKENKKRWDDEAKDGFNRMMGRW